MKKAWLIATAVLLVGALVACAPTAEPTMITPVEQVASMGFEEAYRLAISAINTEPYSSTTSGWVITNSDQTGGFISAQISGRHMEPQGLLGIEQMVNFTARLSVVLVARTETETAVSISLTRDKEAQTLAGHIRAALGLPNPGQ